MTISAQWSEPPRRNSPIDRAREYDALLLELQARPGEWAIIAEGVRHTSAARSMRKRGAQARTQWTQSDAGDGYTIYARWPSARAE